MRDVYERLAKHLDNLPASFPATDATNPWKLA